MSSTLEELCAGVLKDGWASGLGSLEQLRSEARRLGWGEVSFRRTDPPVISLRPLDAADAKPNSLSSRYGAAAQPLHTDGAHLLEPPDLVLLVAEETSAVPTLLWKRPSIGYRLSVTQDMEHGVFLVQHGPESFFSTALSGHYLRYDPGCMSPCDERARNTAQYYAEAIESVVEHHWDEPGTVLLINNRRVLHARAAAQDEPERELKRVAFRLKERRA